MPLEAGRAGDWIEIDDYRYTLLAGQEIQRRPLTQFAPAGQVGPNERPPENPALLAFTQARWDRGFGTGKHQVLEGIDTLRRATLDSRFAWGLVPPPRVDSRAASPSAWLLNRPVLIERLFTSAGTKLYAYGTGNGGATYDVATDVWTAIGGTVNAAIQWRGNTVVVRDDAATGIYTAANGVAFTRRDPSQWAGLTNLDNRLWSFRHDDGKLYNCTDPTVNIGATEGWNIRSEQLYLHADERVVQLHVYRDRGGRPALFVATTRRIWGFDDESGEWELYEDLREECDPTHPQLVTWIRDKILYCVPFGATGAAQRHVYQFVGNMNEIGPTHRGGFEPTLQFGRFRALSGNVHWLYAATEPADTASNGEVVALNDLGGWHTVYRPPEAPYDPIVSVCADGGNVYVLRRSGAFAAIRDKDEVALPWLRYGPGEVDTRLRTAYLGTTDVGMPNNMKIGAYLYIVCYRRDGSMGLPPGALLNVRYRADTGSWRMIPVGVPYIDRQSGTFLTRTGVGGVASWPVRVPLPVGDCRDQRGLPFREIELSVDMQAVAGGDAPVLGEITLYAQRWQEPRWAYQAIIDLREQTVRRRDGNTLERVTLGEARRALETTVATQRLHHVKYGSAEFTTELLAADLVLAGRESPRVGDGLYPITFRDLSVDCDAAVA